MTDLQINWLYMYLFLMLETIILQAAMILSVPIYLTVSVIRI